MLITMIKSMKHTDPVITNVGLWASLNPLQEITHETSQEVSVLKVQQ